MLTIDNQTDKKTSEAKLQYRFDHHRKITFEEASGQITFEVLAAYEKAKISDPEFKESYDIIADIRGATFDLTKDEIIRIYKFIITRTTRISMEGRIAFIADTPNEVVAAELFLVSLKRFGPAMMKIFATEEAALHWLAIR
jgi:hypothetical protein